MRISFYCIFLLGFFFHSLTYGDEVDPLSIAYRVNFEGIPSPSIEKMIKETSDLVLLRDREPPSIVSLKRRAKQDLKNVKDILDRWGYYNAIVNFSIDETVTPVLVSLRVDAGELFVLDNIQILGLPDEEHHAKVLGGLKRWEIENGKPVTTKTILELRKYLLNSLFENGYPFADIETPKIEVSLKQKTINVTLIAIPGSRYRFGKVHILGLTNVKPEYIFEKLSWKEGAWFNRTKILETQKVLDQSGLFNTIEITYEPTTDDLLEIEITTSESKHRSIGAGVNYTSHRGPGILGEWQHRNVFGTGNQVTLSGDIAEKERKIFVLYQSFDFLRKNQDLSISFQEGQEKIRAYKNHYQTVKSWIDRRLTRSFALSLGAAFTHEIATRSTLDGHFYLFSIPSSIFWKHLDNPSRPTIGCTFKYNLEPFFNTNTKDSSSQFLEQRVRLRFYHPLWPNDRISGQFQGTFATITGAPLERIPPPNRIYAGSEQYLRGYSYLTVCPTNDNNKLTGGRSLLVFSADPQIRLIKNLSTGPFFEIGNVYANSAPDLNQKWLKSTGIQLRYHTPIGPLNATLAFPLDKRKEFDKSFQIYVSISKSF